MTNPSIAELQNNAKFELVAELHHEQIKEFVIHQLSEGGRLVKVFMVYQALMLVLGIFIIVRASLMAFQNDTAPLIYIVAALIFCFSFLVVIHELVHGVAIKLTKAPKVYYGAYFKKFIFYAEADRYVMNKKQFAFVALSPLVTVKFITLLIIILTYNHPVVFFLVFVMCAHSLFCAGDVGLLSVFNKYGSSEVFTYDIKDEKKSYYFRRR
jgi:hypothetical protein